MLCEDTGLTLSLKPGVTTEFQIRNAGKLDDGRSAKIVKIERRNDT